MFINKKQIVLNTFRVALYSKSSAQGNLILSRFSVPIGRGRSEIERPLNVRELGYPQFYSVWRRREGKGGKGRVERDVLAN